MCDDATRTFVYLLGSVLDMESGASALAWIVVFAIWLLSSLGFVTLIFDGLSLCRAESASLGWGSPAAKAVSPQEP